MTVRRDGDIAWLEGACRVEEAEMLASLLAAGVRVVDLSRCEALHAALAQALLAWRPELRGAPTDPFLRDHLVPALAGDALVTIPPATGDKAATPSALGPERTEGVQN